MDRRLFIKGAVASAGSFTFGPGLFDGGRARAQGMQAEGSAQSARPNILVIKVDELRFPSVFPSGIAGVDDFLKQFMPNVYQLWQNGVKFTGHYSAACACTPARGTIITGLYLAAELARPDCHRSSRCARFPAALAEPGLPDLRQTVAPGRLSDALHR